MTSLRRALPLSLLALSLASCATSPHDDVIDGRLQNTQGMLEGARRPAPERSSDPLTVSDSVWLGDKVVRMAQGLPLPPEWEKEDSVALRSDNPILLNQLVGVLASETKIPIRLTDGADTLSSGSSGGAAPSAGSAPAPGQPAVSASNGGIVPNSPNDGMIISYSGSLSGLLNLASSFYGVNWRYDGASIVISRYVTRTFVMDALPGTISVQAPSSTSSGGTAATSAEVTPLATASIDIWEDIRKTVSSIVGTNGTVDISQSSGTVVVSTTNDRMERVSRFLSEENKRLGRQVAISIELYSVEVDDSTNYGLDLTAALSSISGLPTVNIAGATTGLTDPAAITVDLVDPTELAGTTGIIQALSTLGRTTRVAQIPITTLNNRPATQKISTDTAYVSSVSSTSSGVDNVSTEAETDTITTGLAVSVLPRIMSDGRILLQYALAQGDLLNIESFPIGDNNVQLPETQGISFSQQVMMKNGSTLVLAGLDQSSVGNNARGVGRPLTWLLGGSTASTNRRNLIVIAITPREIQISRSEAS